MRRFGFDGTQAYIDAARKVPLLTAEEEAELGRRSLAGDMEARAELVRRNQRLVIWIAKRFSKLAPEDEFDLISEGNLGLIRAAKDWNPDRCRFSTYAKPWIRGNVRLYLIEQKPVVRIPNELYEIQSKIRRGVKLTARQVKHWQSLGKYAEAGMVDIGKVVGSLASLKKSRDDPGERCELESEVSSLLGCLPERDRHILTSYVGHGDSINAIANRLGISRQRVEKLYHAAMVRVRDHHKRRMAS